jgi:3'-5' exoribonuclease 1
MTHFLVIDLEATCCNDDSFPRTEMEAIEIGAVIVCPTTFQPIDELQSFIRPVRNPLLTDFCCDLTGISQQQVDAAPLFPIALQSLIDQHVNLKAKFASMNGQRKKLGVFAALRSVGLTFSGSHHRGIDDARNIACLLPYVFPAKKRINGG